MDDFLSYLNKVAPPPGATKEPSFLDTLNSAYPKAGEEKVAPPKSELVSFLDEEFPHDYGTPGWAGRKIVEAAPPVEAELPTAEWTDVNKAPAWPKEKPLQIISHGIPTGEMSRERALKTGGGLTQFAAGLVPGGRVLMGLAAPVPLPENAEERVMGGAGKFAGLLGVPSAVGGKVAGLATKGVAKVLGQKLAPTVVGNALQLGVNRGLSLGVAGVINDIDNIKTVPEALNTFKTYAIMGEIFGLAGMAHLPSHPIMSQVIRQVGGRVLLGLPTKESFSPENIGQTTFNELLNTFFLAHGTAPAEVFGGALAHGKALRIIDGLDEKPTPEQVRAAGGPIGWVQKTFTELVNAAKPVQEMAAKEAPSVLFARDVPEQGTLIGLEKQPKLGLEEQGAPVDRATAKAKILAEYDEYQKRKGPFASELRTRSDEAGTEYTFPDGKKIILSRNLDVGEREKYPLRLTWFDEKGAIMHTGFKDMNEVADEIFHEALGRDGKMPEIQTYKGQEHFGLANAPEKGVSFKPESTAGRQGVLPMPDAAPLFAGKEEKPKPPDTLFSTVPSDLPPQERLPDKGTFPAVMTDDGGIYVDKSTGNNTHVGFILRKGIPPERIRSGGWIVDGVYNADEFGRSDTMRFVDLAKARERLNSRRRAEGKPEVLFSREPLPPEEGFYQKMENRKERKTYKRAMGKPEAAPARRQSDLTDAALRDAYERRIVEEGVAAIREGYSTYDTIDPAYVQLFEKHLDSTEIEKLKSGTMFTEPTGPEYVSKPKYVQPQQTAYDLARNLPGAAPERPVEAPTAVPPPPRTGISARNVPTPQFSPLGRAPQTLGELQTELVRINKGRVSPDQSAALGALVKGVARYKGISPDEYVAGRFAQLEEGGVPTKAMLLSGPEREAALKDAHSRGITDPEMVQKVLNGEPIASVEFLADGKAVIRAFRKSNIAGMAHELGHVFRRDLNPAELSLVERSCGAQDGQWTRRAEEKWARYVEMYLLRGKSPNKELEGILKKFKVWLANIYTDVKTSFGNKHINANVSAVLNKVLGGVEIPATVKPPRPPEVRPVGRAAKGPEGVGTEGFAPWPTGASDQPLHGPTMSGTPPSPVNPVVKTLGPKGMSITKEDLAELKTQKKLPERAVKYSYLNPIYIFEDFPFFKKHLYDKKVDADVNYTNGIKALHSDVKAWQVLAGDKVGQRLWVYAIAQQKGGMKALEANGITEVPDLNANEMRVYTEVRQNLEQMYTRINEARELLGLEPIGKIENYFTFLRKVPEGLEDLGFDPILDPDAKAVTDSLNRPAEAGFFKRRGQTTGPLESHFFKVYESYMRRASKYVENTPVVANAKLLLENIEYKNEAGKTERFGFKNQDPTLTHELKQWVNFSTGHQAPSAIRYTLPPGARRFVEAVNRNIATGVLSANIRSALIQPTSLRNSYIELGRRWLFEGAKRSFSSQRSDAMATSRVLPGREFDIHAAAVKEGPATRWGKAIDIKWKLAEWGITPLKFLDMEAARITWHGAYAKATAPVAAGGRGLTGREAVIYADDIVTKTQASAAPRDIAPIQRTLEGKLATMFQTFVINEWNFLSKHAIGWKNPKMTGPERFSRLMRMAIATAIVNVIYEDVLKMRSPFPTPEHELIKGLRGGQGAGAIAANAAWEMLEPIPVLGGTLRWSTDRRTMYPAVIQAYGDIARLGGKVKKAISEGDLSGFQPEDLSSPLRLAGIPGVGQTEKILRRREAGGTWLQSIMGQKMDVLGSAAPGLTKAERALLKKYSLTPGTARTPKKTNQSAIDELMKKYGKKK